MIKTRKVTKKQIEYYATCENCGKEIKGTTESMVKHNLKIHEDSKECKKKENKNENRNR